MAELNFPSDPEIGDTYVIGIRTWVWNGSGWQLQSGIVSTNPFTVVTAYVTSSTNSTSTDTGALRVVGGVGIGRDVTIGGDINVIGTATVGSLITTGTIYATGIYDTNARVITTATIGNFGITDLSAGTDTAVSSSTGVVVIWSTATLQSITSRSSSTDQAITITNPTDSFSTSTGALIVAGGIGVGGSISVRSTGTIEHLIVGDAYIRDIEVNTAIVNAILTSTNLTNSNDVNSGAIVVAGGVGIGKNLSVGGQINVAELNVTSATIADLTVTNSLRISSEIDADSSSTNIGAVVVDGGVSVVKSVRAAQIYDSGNRVVTEVVPVAGTAISITNLNSSGTTATFTINNIGTTSLTAGTDTAVSTSTGDIVVWSVATLQSITDRSTVTSNALLFTNGTNASSTTTGALVITGGLGVGGNIYASEIYDSDSRVITQATLGNYGVSNITAGTDTVVSTSTGPVVIWSNSTLQSVTSRGSSTDQTIVLTNNLDSNTSTQGALTVAGGVGIGRNLIVGGNAAVYGNLQVYGSTTYVDSTNTFVADPLLELGGGIGGTTISVNDGIDRGLVLHYSTTATSNTSYSSRAFLGMDNPTQTFVFKNNILTGLPFSNVTSFSSLGDWGPARFGSLKLESTTTSINSTTGALIVGGGIGAQGNINISGSLTLGEHIKTAGPSTFLEMTDTMLTPNHSIVFKDKESTVRFKLGSTGSVTTIDTDGVTRLAISTGSVAILNGTTASSTTTGALQVFGGAGVQGDIYAQNMYSNGSQVLTLASLGAAGVSAIVAGTDTAISSSTGQVTIWNTSTLQSVTGRGGVTTNQVSFYYGQDSTSTTTGAVLVNGGIGVEGSVWANAVYDFGSRVVTTGTIFNYAVTELQGGEDISVNTPRGIIVVTNTSTLQSVTTRGSTTTNAINITSSLSVGSSTQYTRSAVNVFSPGFAQTWFNGTGYIDLRYDSGSWIFGSGTNEGLKLGPNSPITVAAGTSSNFIGINTSTPSVWLDVAGDIKGYNIYANGAQVLTTSTIGSYGVSKITTGSGIVITPDSGVGIVNIETTDTLQAVTDRGAATSNAITITSFVTATSTSTGALKVIGGVGIAGDMFVGKTATIMNLVAGPISGTSTFALTGVANFNSTTNATSTNTGAVIVAGGIAVNKDVRSYTGVYDRDQRVVTTVLPTSGNGGIVITNLISTGTTASFAISNSGVLSLTAGTDTVITTATGAVSIWNNSTLQTITNRGSSTNQVVTFSNGLDTNTSTQGTVVVSGGVGVSKNLIVGGNAAVYGNLQVFGTQTFVNSTQTYIIDPILELGAGVGNTSLATNDGFDRGLILHYSTTASSNTTWSNHAFIGMDNATQTFVYKTNVYPGGTQKYTPTFTNTGTFGPARFGSLYLAAGTAATSTATGALIVQGGVGINGSLYAGDMFSNGLQVLTTSSLGSGGVGVSSINAGTDTAVSSTFGAITIWNTSNLQSVTSRGGSTSVAMTITNITNAVSTNSGALIVSGGAGFGKDVYIAGQVNVSNNGNFGTANTNYVRAAGAATGNPATLSAQGSDPTSDLALTGKGNGNVRIVQATGGATGLILSQDIATGANSSRLFFEGSGGTTTVYNNNNGLLFGTNATIGTSSGTPQFRINHTAGALNYLQVTGGSTATGATLSAQGSETIVDIILAPKANGKVFVNSTTATNSTATGALTVAGGVGIAGDLYIGGNTLVQGLGATARGLTTGVRATANGSFSTVGDAQTRKFVMRVSNISNLYTALTTNNGVASAANQIAIPDNSTYSFKVMVVARSTTSNDEGAWEFNGVASRYSGAGTTILRVLNKTKIWSSVAAWDVNISADTINGVLQITGKGDGSNTVRFVANVDTAEVTN